MVAVVAVLFPDTSIDEMSFAAVEKGLVDAGCGIVGVSA